MQQSSGGLARPRFGRLAMLLATVMVAAGLLGASAAPVAAKEKITIAALTFISSSPLFIAQEKGYYADEGLEVEFKFFRAAQPVAVAIVSGDADFGVTAFTGGFYNLAGKGALKVIGAQSREVRGYDGSAILVSNKAYEAGFNSKASFYRKFREAHSVTPTAFRDSLHAVSSGPESQRSR